MYQRSSWRDLALPVSVCTWSLVITVIGGTGASSSLAWGALPGWEAGEGLVTTTVRRRPVLSGP